MFELGRVRGEEDIRGVLQNLLRVVEAGLYRLEVAAGRGFADMVCHEYRIVIETKSRGECNPRAPGAKAGENQEQQLGRYLSAMADSAPSSGSGSRVPWQGFLTDGEVWWGYQWNEAKMRAEPMATVRALPIHTSEGFMDFAGQHLKPRNRSGKAPPPANLLGEVFLPFLDDVEYLQRESEARQAYRTRIELWARVLAGSGIVPDVTQSLGRAETFARHTVLVAGSRILCAVLSGFRMRDEDFVAVVDDGFPGWLAESGKGRDLIVRLSERLRQYEWREMTRDVLKDVYHGLIRRDIRKEFGEYYTPDWLAAWVVERTLDDAWLDRSIRAAVGILNAPGRRQALPQEFGVLDPSCGSGTFLFHAARRIHHRIREAFPDCLQQARKIMLLLVHGIDVHPVAVEMSKATLAMALPERAPRERKDKSFSLQIFLGDAMHSEQDYGLLDADSIEIRSSDGEFVRIPRALMLHVQGPQLVRRLVEGARQGKQKRFAELAAADRALAHAAIRQLAEVIKKEGNHIWEWYISNVMGPLRLSERKVGCMVGNPPWLVANDTPDGARKKAIGRMRANYALRMKGSATAKGDLASVFTARATDLYLAQGGRFAYVLPGSAVINQTWEPWRSGNWKSVQVDVREAWDLDRVEPSAFAHAPNGTCVVFGHRAERAGALSRILRWRGPCEAPVAEQRNVRASESSTYLFRFRRGAVFQPASLLLTLEDPERSRIGGADAVAVPTKTATKKPWIGTERVAHVERRVLMPILRSQELQPFCAAPCAWLIVPRSADGLRVLDLEDSEFRRLWPRTRRYWTEAERTYAEHRSPNAGVTLTENLDYKKTLSRQLEYFERQPGRRKVFYNKSGMTLRAARGSMNLLADDKLYYLIAHSEREALFLIGVLNAECLQDAWRESKTSKMHFDKSPWRHVPVPEYSGRDRIHKSIADAALKAEKNPAANRMELEHAVRLLLPDYASAA